MRPLADKIRPKSLDEVVGQKHLVGQNGVLRRIIESNNIPNMIFYGPSGTGKTTIANIIASLTNKALYRINATSAGSQDIKDVINKIGTLHAQNGILLYLDEIQYFSKKQQQLLLEYIENGEYKGFDIELMKYLGERKNFNVEFVNMDFDEMMVAVQTGKVDCAISGICITEERKQHLEFTDAYMDCNVTYVENGETVQSEESYAIALAKDTIFDSILNSAIADAKQAKIPQLAEKYGIIFDAETGYYEYSIGQINTTTDQNQGVSTEGTKIYFVSTGTTESDKVDKQIVCTTLAYRLDYCGYTGSSVTVNEFGELNDFTLE